MKASNSPLFGSLEYLYENEMPVLSIEGLFYRDIFSFLTAYPALKQEPCVAAEALNFLVNGYEYEVITDPQDYFIQYEKELKEESLQPINASYPRRSDWGIYDLSKISAPKWHGEELKFAAERNMTRIPYQVIFKDNKIGYLLFPYK